jgi:hypothetical protein
VPSGLHRFDRFDNRPPIRHNPGMEENTDPSAVSRETGDVQENRPVSPFRSIEFYQPPRLGIIHLLAWVTGAVILMKFNLALEAFHAFNEHETEQFRQIAKILDMAQQILCSAILVAGFVFSIDRCRRKSGKIQPGHWIIGIQSIEFPAFILLSSLTRIFFYEGIFRISTPIYAGIMLLVSIAYFWGAIGLPEPRRWKFGLGLLGLEIFGYCLLFFGYSLFTNPIILFRYIEPIINYFEYGVTAFLVIVVIIDLLKGMRRDWLHWLGAVTPIVVAIISIVWRVAYQLLRKNPDPF